MYSPHAQKIATEIMYVKQLVDRARTLPLGDLENEVQEYEFEMERPDQRRFLKRTFDYWSGVDNFRFDQYEVNKKVLGKRKSLGGNA